MTQAALKNPPNQTSGHLAEDLPDVVRTSSCCGRAHEVKLCPSLDCTLYSRRFGRRPNPRSEMASSAKNPPVRGVSAASDFDPVPVPTLPVQTRKDAPWEGFFGASRPGGVRPLPKEAA